MTIYVDDLQTYGGRGRLSGQWCHMASDNYDDLTELHAMAQKIGMRREWFQDHPTHPHYDLRPTKRELAIKAGAIPVDGIELVKRCSKMFRPKQTQ